MRDEWKCAMSGMRRCVMTGLALAVAGCAFGRKPYADDPLIRSHKAVWGDFEKARSAPDEPPSEPISPTAPNQPLVGTSVASQ